MPRILVYPWGVLSCFCCILSIAIYMFLDNMGSDATTWKTLKSLKDILRAQPHVYAIIECGHLPCSEGDDVSDCLCLDEADGGCNCETICILWTTPTDLDALQAAVLSAWPRSSFITSRKQRAQDVIAHFFIMVHNGHLLHFANWFQQDDGSWWFDKLASKPDASAADSNRFFIGKYEGWMKRFVIQQGIVLDTPANRTTFCRHLRSSRFVACDEEQAHQFHLKEGRDVSPEAERFRHHAWRLLAAAATTLDELEVPFWLSSGTCLGYYRQCDFVPYMGDVDIGVHITSLRDWAGDRALPSVEQVTRAMEARRLRLVHRFGRPSDSLELSFRSPDGIKLDVFFFYDDGDVVWNGGTQARTGRKFRYEFEPFELCWTVFRELRVRVPCDTERYLLANYGPGWREPQPVWDWKSSPPNVRENGVWPEAERHEVVQLLEP